MYYLVHPVPYDRGNDGRRRALALGLGVSAIIAAMCFVGGHDRVWQEWGRKEEFTAFQSPFIVLIQVSIRHRSVPPH